MDTASANDATAASSAPLGLAQLPFLILPLGKVRKQTLAKWLPIIEANDTISQNDIPLSSSAAGGRGRFLPNIMGGSSGSGPGNTSDLRLRYIKRWSTELAYSLEQFSLFRTSLFPMAVICLVDLDPSCTPSIPAAHELFQARMEVLFPSGSAPFPPCMKCWAVEGMAQTQVQISAHEEALDMSTGSLAGGDVTDVIVIPDMKDPSFFLKSLLADICGQVLGELSNIANAIESPPGMSFMQSSTFPPLSILPRSQHQPFQMLSPSPSPITNALGVIAAPAAGIQSPSDSISNGTTPSRASTMPISMPGDSSSIGNGFPPALSRTATSSSIMSLGSLSGPGTPNPNRSMATSPSLRSLSSSNDSPKTSLGGPGRKRNVTTGQQSGSPSTLSLASPTQGVAGSIAGLKPPRLLKILADFYLLSGKLAEAAAIYADALAVFIKSSLATDTLWHASALEGYATALLLQSLSSNPPPSLTTQPFHIVSSHLLTSISLYSKSSPQASRQETDALPLLYNWCTLRHARMMGLIWSGGGWNPRTFQLLTSSSIPEYPPPTIKTNFALSASSGLSRAQISGFANMAHGPWLFLLPPHEKLATLRIICGIHSSLDLRRKEAALIRTIVNVILDMIVTSRTSSESDASTSRHSYQSGGAVTMRLDESGDGNQGLLDLLKAAMEVLGVEVHDVEEELMSVEINGEAKEGSSHQFGWPILQVEILREAVKIAEALPDQNSIILFSQILLSNYHAYLSPTEQARLASLIASSIAVARRRGLPSQVGYWAGRTVMSMEIVPLPQSRLTIEHGVQELAMVPDGKMHGIRDPFLYNPRLKSTNSLKNVVVQNETVELLVTLQNPFSFDLDLQHIRPSTVGVDFHPHPCAVVLPPHSFQTIRLSGFCTSPGSLTILGCVIRLPDGAECEFVLPIQDALEVKRRSKRDSIKVELERNQRLSGLVKDVWKLRKRSSVPLDGGEAQKPVPEKHSANYMICEVVPAQPLLRIRSTSLTHAAVMLYNGETSIIRLTVENIGSLPVDFLKLSFQDSITTSLQAILAEGNLSAGEAYEIENDVEMRPIFQWDNPEGTQSVIVPGAKKVLNIKCLGKVGCTSGTIQISYACLDREGLKERSGTFHTRQISYPILVTVYHTLECSSMDLLRLGQDAALQTSETTASSPTEVLFQKSALEGTEEDCLFAIDVRNVYGQPFEVNFQRKSATDGEPPLTATRIVTPGGTERFALPVKRLLLDHNTVSQHIPSLTERQFVVAKSVISPEEEKITKQLFWYREELLRLVSAVWKEPGSGRIGEISLRNQRLSQPMLEVLKADEIKVSLSAVYAGKDVVSDSVEVNDFITIVANVQNRLSRPFHARVRVEPLPLVPSITSWATSINDQPFTNHQIYQLQAPPSSIQDTSSTRFLVYDGALSTTLPVLQPGNDAQFTIPIAFLAKGVFEFRAAVEEIEFTHRKKKKELEELSKQSKKKQTAAVVFASPPTDVYFSSALHVRVE